MNPRPMEVEWRFEPGTQCSFCHVLLLSFGKILCVSQWLKEDELIEWFTCLFSATTVSHDCETQVRPRLDFINLMFLMGLVKALLEQHRRRELGLYPATWRWEWTAEGCTLCWESESLRPETWLSGQVCQAWLPVCWKWDFLRMYLSHLCKWTPVVPAPPVFQTCLEISKPWLD